MVLNQKTKQSNLVNIHHFHVHYSFMLNNAALKENAAFYDFMEFTLKNAGDMAEAVGYVRLPDEMYEEGLTTLEGLK